MVLWLRSHHHISTAMLIRIIMPGTLTWFTSGSSHLRIRAQHSSLKNSSLTNTDQARFGYFKNLQNTLNDPQNNNISFKILYYIDYQNLRKKTKSVVAAPGVLREFIIYAQSANPSVPCGFEEVFLSYKNVPFIVTLIRRFTLAVSVASKRCVVYDNPC